MKLFYLPGSCALGPHIALEYCGLAYETARIERGRQTDPTYLAINPLGLVPALVTATHGTITEVPAILSYIADVATGHGLLPAIGTPDRYEALRWMAYLSSTLHPAFGRLWRAERFCDDADCKSSVEHGPHQDRKYSSLSRRGCRGRTQPRRRHRGIALKSASVSGGEDPRINGAGSW
jgi:glutathione S-transferase